MESPALHHFRLHFFAAAARALAEADRAPAEVREPEKLRFLDAYADELRVAGVDGASNAEWVEAVEAFEAETDAHLPIRALRTAGQLDHTAMMLLCAVGLVEEDARFGQVFAALQGAPSLRRPTQALLCAWFADGDDASPVRARLRALIELGLVEVPDRSPPRAEWSLHVAPAAWDALRGEAAGEPAPGVRHRRYEELLRDPAPLLPEALREAIERLPPLLGSGSATAVVIRGPARNGRRTLLRAVARSLRRGVLEVPAPWLADGRVRALGPLCTLLHAMPVLTVEAAPGEQVEVPALPCCDAPLGVAAGRLGGLAGPGLARSVTIDLPLPARALRLAHWEAALGESAGESLEEIADRFRLGSGALRSAARLALAEAALRGRKQVLPQDVQEAARSLRRSALDAVALRLPAAGDWSQLAASAGTLRELRALETRCRHRETLPAAAGIAGKGMGAGVRALFSGPSGTGKTLAARLLASELRLDAYRVDLAAVVNKFIGETEKNLDRVLTLAEELDVLLVFDEGDALLARRTQVGSSNDRYANLETNYLLQRLEAYDGIAVATTNAVDAIDSAFERRFDVVVEFKEPEPAERWQLWQLHLPAGHGVDSQLLRELSSRCALSGGQIRNAAIHAALLALQEGTPVATQHVEEAVQREYRKQGAVYPLRRHVAALRR